MPSLFLPPDLISEEPEKSDSTGGTDSVAGNDPSRNQQEKKQKVTTLSFPPAGFLFASGPNGKRKKP